MMSTSLRVRAQLALACCSALLYLAPCALAASDVFKNDLLRAVLEFKSDALPLTAKQEGAVINAINAVTEVPWNARGQVPRSDANGSAPTTSFFLGAPCWGRPRALPARRLPGACPAPPSPPPPPFPTCLPPFLPLAGTADVLTAVNPVLYAPTSASLASGVASGRLQYEMALRGGEPPPLLLPPLLPPPLPPLLPLRSPRPGWGPGCPCVAAKGLTQATQPPFHPTPLATGVTVSAVRLWYTGTTPPPAWNGSEVPLATSGTAERDAYASKAPPTPAPGAPAAAKAVNVTVGDRLKLVLELRGLTRLPLTAVGQGAVVESVNALAGVPWNYLGQVVSHYRGQGLGASGS